MASPATGRSALLGALILALGLVAACDTVASLQVPTPKPFQPIAYPKTAYERMVDARIAAAENCIKASGVPVFAGDTELKDCHFPPAPTIENHYGPVGEGTGSYMGTYMGPYR